MTSSLRPFTRTFGTALALANATLGVLVSASLAVHAIGQGLAQALGKLSKHGVKQVDRLLSNQGVDVWEFFGYWIPYLVGARTEVVVAMDWTSFARDQQDTVVLSMLTGHQARQRCADSGASMPWSRMRSGPNLRVSPSVTVATPEIRAWSGTAMTDPDRKRTYIALRDTAENSNPETTRTLLRLMLASGAVD